MTAVLAIDQGTSGTKALVVDSNGDCLASAEVPVLPSYGAGGAVTVSPEDLWRSLVEAGNGALHQVDVTVGAVSLANQGESVLAWDPETGEACSPVVVWQDRRAQVICDERRGHADMLRASTGLQLGPYFTAPKMRWLRDRAPDRCVITTTDSWLVHRLCGQFVTDASTAGRSMLLALGDESWSPALMDVFGLDAERMPDVMGCDEVIGNTTTFGDPIPVAGLIVDQAAALLAQGCVEKGEVKCTYGTGAFLLAQAGDEPIVSSSGLSTSVAWRLNNRTSYCLDGQVYTAASAVRWLTSLGLIQGAEQLDVVVADRSGGVVCVPAFAGLAAPWWDADARACFTGLSLDSGPGHVVRAVLEGLAAQVTNLVTGVEGDLGTAIGPLKVDGGLTRSRTLVQAQADIAQRPVEVYPSPHATAVGAAVCGQMAISGGAAESDAARSCTPAAIYEPRWSADQADDYMDRWTKAVKAAQNREALS